MIFGENNAVLNCFVHYNDFIGTTASCVELGGKGNILSHSTLTRSGRSVLGFPNMYRALVQNCDMSYSGMLTSDLGLTYGNVIEGGNSEIRFNLLHHNEGDHFNMGLYYDHGTQNIISHHNIIYGVDRTAFQLNHYAAYHLVYNNTFISEKYGFKNIWGNQYLPELNGVRIVNNVFSGPAESTASNYHWSNNVTGYKGFDPNNAFKVDKSLLYRGQYISGISTDSIPGLGALETKGRVFTVGHDFANPPHYDTIRSKPLHRNMILNSAFEHEDHLSPWQSKMKIRKVDHKAQNQTTEDKNMGRMGRHSIELLEQGSEVFQKIAGLRPNTMYKFMAFLNVDKEEMAVIGIRYPDKTEFLSPMVSSSKTNKKSNWRKVGLSFNTGNRQTEVTVFARRLTHKGGTVYFDDSGVILESN